MTVKQKIKYSVQYDKNSDTLSEKLNVLLNNIVTLILTNNPSLTETSRITYGSEQMTGEPLYDSSNTIDVYTRKYQSDLVFIGLNKKNIVLSIGFYDGRLVIAMNVDPYVESLYMDNWNSLRPTTNTFRVFATGKASRWKNNVSYNRYNVNLPYLIINGEIQISVVYWKGANSNGYLFYNAKQESNGVDLVFYKTNEGETESLGCALWKYSPLTTSYNNINPAQLLTWSFSENLTDNMISDHKLSYVNGTYSSNIYRISPTSTVTANSKYDMREWFFVNCDYNHYNYGINSASYINYVSWTGSNMADFHTLGSCDGKSSYDSSMPAYDTVETSTTNYTNITNYHLSALCTAYNLPYLNNDNEIYLRQVRIPGFVKNCIGELYLMWTPSKEPYNSGDIIEVDGDNYAIINNGIVCWSVKV